MSTTTMSPEDFWDLSKVETTTSLLPPDKYTALITGIEKKDTKAGDGAYLNVELTITTQGHQGRKIFDKITIVNKNQQAVQIGMKKLATLSEAAGYAGDNAKKVTASMLANKEIGIATKIVSDETYGDRAEVARYLPTNKLPQSAKVNTSDVPF